ncbi:hypothetical protein E4U60_005363 [Claviceps pazoutovae]|uniref:Uncharacterized protein n=1 Tax=Claviceps pazoutovae TaxID=1649127 RepID=A0A9P7SEG8_9HYPO|nr:hypothetical protein E4U60_005363 [Claviceps pazoutovae]
MPRALGRPMKLCRWAMILGCVASSRVVTPKSTLTELPWVPSARLEGLWKVCRPMLDAKVGRTRSATADEQCNKDKDCLTVQTLDNSIEKAVQKVLRTLSPAEGLRGRLSLLEAPPARYCTVSDL